MRYRALEEGKWIFAVLAAACFASAFWILLVSLFFGLALLFSVYFFRDPERVPPPGEDVAVAPADGLVDTIDEVEESEFLNTRLRRIGIFLSVLDVHVNRAPLAAEVLHSEPKSGGYLDARNPLSSTWNVSRTWVFAGEAGTVIVRQITGAIARRICSLAFVGDRVPRGGRFGMIRFGSRTELLLPLDAEILVQIGDRVKGGQTAVAKMGRKCGNAETLKH